MSSCIEIQTNTTGLGVSAKSNIGFGQVNERVWETEVLTRPHYPDPSPTSAAQIPGTLPSEWLTSGFFADCGPPGPMEMA